MSSLGIDGSVMTFALVVLQLRAVPLVRRLFFARVVMALGEGIASDIILPRSAIIILPLISLRSEVLDSLLE